MTVLDARGVVRTFGPVRALAGVDLRVEDGQVMAVLGPSGCGKTTLLRIIAGFMAADAGSVELGSRPVLVDGRSRVRSEEHTFELQSLMRLSSAVLCLTKTKKQDTNLQIIVTHIIE